MKSIKSVSLITKTFASKLENSPMDPAPWHMQNKGCTYETGSRWLVRVNGQIPNWWFFQLLHYAWKINFWENDGWVYKLYPMSDDSAQI